MNNIKIDNQKLEDHLRMIFQEKAEKENRLEKIIISLGKQAMVDENWQEAEQVFSQLLAIGGSVHIESLWHLSLIQLKTGDLAQCKTYLQELIATKDPTYIKEARKLMRAVT